MFDMMHYITFTGETLSNLFSWCMTPKLKEDVIRIMSPGNEVGKVFSYAAYASDLHLTMKNPMSALLNGNLHALIHQCCALLGSKQSMPSEGDDIQTTKLGILMAYAHRRCMRIRHHFAPTAEEARTLHYLNKVEEETGGRDAEIDGAPVNTSGFSRFIFLTRHRMNLPSFIKANF